MQARSCISSPSSNRTEEQSGDCVGCKRLRGNSGPFVLRALKPLAARPLARYVRRMSETTSPARAEATVKTKEEFDKLLAEAKGPVLVDFIQPTCQPCIDETENFNKLAASCKDGSAKVMRIDVTEGFGAELAEKLDVEGTPTALIADSSSDFLAGKTREVHDLTAPATKRKLKCAL
jgi:thiol-disulfide isomerase/thioredoxin